MEVFLIRLLQFMLSISILVLLHEGGHFFFSKLFGVRVEKFYLFFDPSIWKWDGSLFKWKPKKSDTTYGVGWLPLGGYCKISGMIDESFDTEQMKQPPQPWEFRTKPAWQRLLIMIGGVLVNFLLALFIYSMVLFYWGDSYIQTKDMTMGMKFNTEAKKLGFKDGDILLGTEKKAFTKFDIDLYRQLSDAKRVDIIRDGKQMAVNLPGELNLLDMIQSEPSFVRPLIPADIDTVMHLLPRDAVYYWVQPTSKRAFPADKVTEEAERAGLKGRNCGSVANGYRQALADATPDDFIFVGGSSYVVADLLALNDF